MTPIKAIRKFAPITRNKLLSPPRSLTVIFKGIAESTTTSIEMRALKKSIGSSKQILYIKFTVYFATNMSKNIQE